MSEDADFKKAVAGLASVGRPGVYTPSIILAFQHVLRGMQQGTLSASERDTLDDHVVRVYHAGHEELSRGYDHWKVEMGFSGARGLIAKWGTPFELRHLRNPKADELCSAHLMILLNDLGSLYLQESIAERLSSFTLPRMPGKVEPDSCEVVPFPNALRRPTGFIRSGLWPHQ